MSACGYCGADNHPPFDDDLRARAEAAESERDALRARVAELEKALEEAATEMTGSTVQTMRRRCMLCHAAGEPGGTRRDIPHRDGCPLRRTT